MVLAIGFATVALTGTVLTTRVGAGLGVNLGAAALLAGLTAFFFVIVGAALWVFDTGTAGFFATGLAFAAVFERGFLGVTDVFRETAIISPLSGFAGMGYMFPSPRIIAITIRR
jgi:hypothetical protein